MTAGWSGRAVWLAGATLAAAATAILVRYVLVAGAAATYNEAVYIELARHPWQSSYYPDTFFVRHPPLSFLVLAVWQAATDEAWPRLPGLIFTLGGLGLSAAAAARRGGPLAAALVAATLGASWLTWAYALQATMYPLAFLLASWGLFAYVRHDGRSESAAWTLLALTHLFGFVFVVARIARHRHAWRRELAWASPAFVWLAVAVPLGLMNPGDGIIRLGPLGQGLRTFGTAAEWLTGMAVVHVGAMALAGWSLAAWAWPAWRDRRLWPGLALPVLLLTLFLAVGAPFARYALFLLPFVAVAGAVAVVQTHASRMAAAGLAVALLSVPVSLWYIENGPDPRDDADVPGMLRWDEAAPLVAGIDVATSAPPALALALEPYGWRVVDGSQGPWILVLGNGTHTMHIVRVDWPYEVDGPAVVPATWDLPACQVLGGLSVVGVCAEP